MENNTINEKHEKLKHLTDNQIEELINRYYSDEKISDIINEFKIDITPSMLYSILPPEISKDKICPNCNVHMVKLRKSRSGYSGSNDCFYCKICNHIENSTFCVCDSCSKKREEQRLKREEEKRLRIIKQREQINNRYSIGRFEPVNIDKLNFREKVYLGTLLRCCLSEDFSIINSINSVDGVLAPTEELKREIVTTLSHKNIIIVHPNSPIEAFTESDNSPFPNVYYIYDVNYYLNLEFSGDKYKAINDLMNPSDINNTNSEEAFNIWKEIALAECLEYLDYQMKKVKFDFTPGKKTVIAFNDLLDNFSVSQIYGIIYRSISNATRYYQESTVNKKKAANSVVGGCQRYAEQALVNNWDINKFKRNYDLPQTKISEFFFYRVIKIGDLGFDFPPTI